MSELYLAPMAGVTDNAFRIICKNYGVDYVTSEMVSAKGLYYGDKKTASLMTIHPDEPPCSIQIFGSDPDIMSEVVPKVEEFKPCAIDINMGCPMPKIVNNGDGSALMKNPKLASQVVSSVAKSTKLPVTVKMRIGWDKNIGVEFAKMLESSGASQITVHGRLREQFYSGKADWETIAKIKKAVKIPVVANGDVFCAEDAKRLMEVTGCDKIAVGRGSEGNPFIFRQIKEYLSTGCVSFCPTASDKLTQALNHTRLLCSFHGESRGIKEARKHIAWYIKGIRSNNAIKTKVFTITTLAEMETLLLSAIDTAKELGY